MKLTKNPEVTKLLTTFAIFFIIFLILISGAVFISMNHFNNTIAWNQAAIVGAIAQSYPDGEQDMIEQIIDAYTDRVLKGQSILEKYGINSSEMLFETASMGRIFRMNLTLYLFLGIIAGATFILILLKFFKKQYAQVSQLTEYSREVARGKYSLDIRDNNVSKWGRFSTC